MGGYAYGVQVWAMGEAGAEGAEVIAPCLAVRIGPCRRPSSRRTLAAAPAGGTPTPGQVLKGAAVLGGWGLSPALRFFAERKRSICSAVSRARFWPLPRSMGHAVFCPEHLGEGGGLERLPASFAPSCGVHEEPP